MIKWETEFQHYKECQKNKKQYCNPKKVSGVRHKMYSLKWSTTLPQVQMIIKQYKCMMEVQALEECTKQSWWGIQK